jgi:hypothetical protein
MDEHVEVLGGFGNLKAGPTECFRFTGQINGRSHRVYVWRSTFDDAADAFAQAYPSAGKPDEVHQLDDGLWREVVECQ